MVEHPGQKSAGRSSQAARSATVNLSRPLSADDIQKAKLRAQYLQNKNGKSQPSQTRPLKSPSKAQFEPDIEKSKASVVSLPPKGSTQQGAYPGAKKNLDVDEPLWKTCKKVQIKWKTPAGMRIPEDWSVGTGEDSKESEIQKNRNHRQKETIYRTNQEIPCDPNEPWDPEMEYDDSLTLEIPIEQLPDNENEEVEVETPTPRPEPTPTTSAPSNMPQSTRGQFDPDPELLAELLRHPELVFALQGGGLSGNEMVKLLDMIKSNGVEAALGLLNGGFIGRKSEESVAVSLPSPTPSRDPVTSNWRTEVSYNPFSRQERETMPTMAQQQQIQPKVQALPQQVTTQYSMLRAPGIAPQMHPMHMSNIPNLPPTNCSIPNPSPTWTQNSQNSGYVNPTQFSIPNAQQAWVQNRNQNQMLPSQNPPHYMQPQYPSNFDRYGRPYRERNEAGFESWSPENSPTRHAPWGYPNERINQNPNMGQYQYNNYRPEYDQSSRQWNSSGFWDFNGPGSSKRHRR